MPVVVTALFPPLEGRHGQVLEAIGRVIPAVHREDGCELAEPPAVHRWAPAPFGESAKGSV